MKFRQAGSAQECDVELPASTGEAISVRINGEEIIAAIEANSADELMVRIGSRTIRVFVAHQRDAILVAAGPAQFEFIAAEGRLPRRAHGLATPDVVAPMPGKVVKIVVDEGQQVAAGDALLVLEAMKMETVLQAESAAVVKKIRATVGQMVDHGAPLLELSPAPPPPGSEAAEQAH
jgi:acetyl-CoA/propionyl-CoA carboxylase biotin carboxyl carrier protein